MTDNEMIERLKHAALKRDGFDAVYLATPAEERITALTAERDALKAARVKVKPLVWDFEQEDVQVANTSARHQYRIVFDHRATVGAWMWFCDGRWVCCETEEAAKAAAQADYEARILAALELTPDTSQIDAIRAALEAAAMAAERLFIDAGNSAGREHGGALGCASEIRALDPAAIAAKLKGDGDDR